MKRLLPVILSLLLCSCTSYNNIASDDTSLNSLYQLMQGSYSSQKQSEADENYYDIRLEMVPIWEANKEALWLYVEQAAAAALERPYRQRVYKITQLENGKFSSAVYELPNAHEHAGAWKRANPLSELSPADLKLREGCAVILSKQSDGHFKGSTVEKECKSTLRGARYATSIVELGAQGITSWDQGFNANDEQVWGAEKGPYIFLRK